MVSVVHVSMFVHTTAPRSICLFGVCSRCPSVLTWTNLRACGCLLAPLSGITLTTRAIRSQHYTLFNSYKLVRPPRLLCSRRPQHEGHMVRRLQVLCPAHTSHSVLPILRFRWTPTHTITSDLLSATLAEAATQLSFAASLERCISVSASQPLPLPVPTPPLDAATQTYLHTAATRDVSTQLSFREFFGFTFYA